MNHFSQKSALGKVRTFILKNRLIEKGDHIAVAFSGGPDSTCLFEILAELQKDISFELSACHYNHRLRGEESEADNMFVREFCRKRGIDCFFGEAKEKNEYKNEEEARNARYAFFQKILQEGSVKKIAIAHNKNDFAETTLMRLIRGSGLKGLSSIPRTRKEFIRPLLCLERSEILNYLSDHNVSYRTDSSNFDQTYLRNHLRLEIIPRLLKINPNLIENLANSSETIEEDYNLLEVYSREVYRQIVLDEDEVLVSFDFGKWSKLHPALQRMTLRLGIEKLQGLSDISYKQLSEIENMLKKAVGKKQKLLPYSLRIELLNGKIIITKLIKHKV